MFVCCCKVRWFVGLLVWRVCALIDVCPSHATKLLPISRPTTSMKDRYLHVQGYLLASKAVVSSWSLVVVCTQITRISSRRKWDFKHVPAWYQAPGTIHDRTVYTRIIDIWYVQVPGFCLHHTYSYMDAYNL